MDTKGRGAFSVNLRVLCWLLHIAVLAVILLYSWPDFSVGVAQSEKDRQQVLTFKYTDSYWNGAQTIEEAWPNIVSRQAVPRYYEELVSAAKLLDETGYAGHKGKVKPYAELTRSERLLLARRIPKHLAVSPPENYKDWRLLDLLDRCSDWPSRGSMTTEAQREMILSPFYYAYYMVPAARELRRKEVIAELGSPISNTIIAILQKDYSPGDAYCERIIDKKADVIKARDSWLQHYTYKDTYSREKIYYVYFRIYGETEVIAEGLYRARSRLQ